MLTPATLVSLNNAGSGGFLGGLTVDAGGDLFGTTYAGGTNNDGIVFEIANAQAGSGGTPAILVSSMVRTAATRRLGWPLMAPEICM